MQKFLNLRWFTRILTSSVIFLLAVLQLVTPVHAATLLLTSIGSSSTVGQSFSTWTYTRANPTFTGTAAADATVTISINETANTATADAAGAWVFTPTTLVEGTHTIVITSGTETINFALIISPSGSSASTSGTTTTATDSAQLPVTGGMSLTLLLVMSGLTAIGLGLVNLARVPAEDGEPES